MNTSSPSYRAISALSPLEQKIFWIALFVSLITGVLLLLKFIDTRMVEVPKQGGTLTEGVIGFPRHINPVIARTDTDRDLAALIYSGLVRKMPDGSYQPDLAENVLVSEDGKTYTVTIRAGLRWHDGTPVTSHDVAFTVAAMVDGAREIKGVRRASWEGIEVQTPDDRTVVFVLPTSYAPFIEQLSMGILPAHLWESVPREQFDLSSYNLKPVGTGPYMIEDVISRSDGIPVSYTLKAFKHFALGRPYIETVVISFYGNREELLRAYENGEVTAISDVDPALGKTLSTQPNTRVLSSPLDRVFAVYFNQAHNVSLSDKAVRSALEILTDREALINQVLLGYGSSIDGPIPPGRYGMMYTSTSTPDERSAQAEALLEKAGWTKGENGFYEKKDAKKKTSTPLTLSISTGDTEELKQAAEFIAELWREKGIDVEAKVYDKSTLAKEVITPRQYDALLYGAVADKLPDLFPFWHSSQRTDPGLNIAMYANSKADTFLEQARGATTTEEEAVSLQGFLDEIRIDKPAIFLYSPSFIYALNEKIGGVTIGPMTTKSDRFASIFEWYTKTERVWHIFAKDRPHIIHQSSDS